MGTSLRTSHNQRTKTIQTLMMGRETGEKKGTLVRVLAPKRALYHVLTSQESSLVCFNQPRGQFSVF